MIKNFDDFFEYENEEDDDIFEVGDKVIKNELTWIPNDFDRWGRGLGIGVIVDPPFEMEDNEVDVKWSCGRCIETTDQLKKQKK